MTKSWKDIIQRDGDGPVGPPLLRLAQMAVAVPLAESLEPDARPEPEAERRAQRTEASS